MKFLFLGIITLLASNSATAQSYELEPFHSGQDQGSVSLAFFDATTRTPYVGMSADAGRSLTSHITVLGQFGAVSLDGLWLTSYEGGGRLNLATRGRFIPYVVGTAGLLHVGAFGSGANGFGFSVGGGLIVRINNLVETKFELKENQIVRLGGLALNSWYTTATAGIGFRFDSWRPDNSFSKVTQGAQP